MARRGHAAARYLERCGSHLLDKHENRGRALQAARLEMRQLMATAPWSYEWPKWLDDNGEHGAGDDAPGHLRIGKDVVFVLARPKRAAVYGNPIVVTVLTRESGLVQ